MWTCSTANNYAAQGSDLLLPSVEPQTGQYVVGANGKYVPVYYPHKLSGTIIPTIGAYIEF